MPSQKRQKPLYVRGEFTPEALKAFAHPAPTGAA